MKNLLAVALGIVAASAMADITLVGPTVISASTTVSEKVTGGGYYVIANGATLKLTHADNDFTGGIVVSNGFVQAEASGALGSGDIVFVANTNKTSSTYVDSDRYNRGVYLSAAGGTFPNNFIVRDIDAHSDYPTIRAIKSATVTGDITTPDGRKINLSADSGYTLTVTGDITTPTLWDIAKGRIVLKGKVTASTFQHGSTSSQSGTLELWNPENQIDYFTMKLGSVECMAENVLYGTKICWNINTWYMDGTTSQIRLNGYSQAVGGIHDTTTVENLDRIKQSSKTTSVITPDDKPATVTVIGTQANWWPTTMVRFFGPISIVGNKKESGYTCVPRCRWLPSYGLTGTLATSNTTFYILNGAAFTNAAALVAAKDGTFSCDAITNALTGLTRIEIAGNLTCSATCVTPINAPKADMFLTSGAVLKFGAGVTNTVKRLVVNGEYLPAGVYTKANLSQMNVSGKASDATAALVVNRTKAGIALIVR